MEISQTPHVNPVRLVAFRFLAVFVVLFIVSLPFPYAILPSIGEYLRPCSEALVKWTGDHVFHLSPPYTFRIASDSTGMYIHTFDVLIISAVVCAAWSVLDRRRADYPRLRRWFRSAAAYYLALQLLAYGFDKLFKHQFYIPEPNTLYTPVGYLSRDILYWSVMGSSYYYNLFAGLLEVMPVVLLLFRRTRQLGAIIALVAVANIIAINFGFDISVKIYSCFLLLLCVVVAAPGLRNLFDLFILNRSVHADTSYPKFDSQRKILIYSGLKAIVIGVVLLETLFIYFKTWYQRASATKEKRYS